MSAIEVCPVCRGAGLVPASYAPIGPLTTSTTVAQTCHVCWGTGRHVARFEPVETTDSGAGEPGSSEWWRSPGYTIHGSADTILRLLEQEAISRRKALELLAYLHDGCPQAALPPAPWDALNWCDDPLSARVADLLEAIALARSLVPDATDVAAVLDCALGRSIVPHEDGAE